jgi:uncharacterized membrane protein YfcA
MTASHALILLGAGLLAGAVNAIAGGGSLISFPALLATGLAPVPANVTNSVAVFPGYAASVAGSRHDLRDLADQYGRGRLVALVPTTVAGTAVGCVALLATPSRAFEWVVPFLVLGAGAALVLQDRLRRFVSRRYSAPRHRMVALHATVGLGAVYGGYFGAALGVLLVAALGVLLDTALAHVNALKNAISALAGLVTVVAFALFGPVRWADVAILAPAAIVGGYGGARLARLVPAAVLRALIAAFAVLVGAVLLLRALR